MRLCIVYVVKEVVWCVVGQLMGTANNRMRTWALQISRKKAAVDYEETGINSYSRCNIFSKVYKKLEKVRRVDN